MEQRPLTQKEIDEIAKDIVNNENIDDVIWEIEKDLWRERPVDIWKFLYHPDYLGSLYNNEGTSGIYPFWMRLMDDLYPSPFYTKYNEVLLSTGIGIGKSTITCGAISPYENYKLLCLKNPATYYGLLSNSIIVTALFSSTMDLVTGVNWPKMRDAMVMSPWFRERLNINEQEPKLKSLDLDKNVAVQIGSRTQHAISRDVLIAIVDEGNAGVLNDQVRENYNEIYRRRKSRFENGFRVPGLLLACSSPKGEDDFINSRIEREKGNPGVLVVDNVAEWGESFGGQKTVDGIYLVEDVSGCEVSLPSLFACLAEEAVHLAAHLTADAECGSVAVGHVDCLHGMSVEGGEEELHCAVFAPLNVGRFGTPHTKQRIQHLSVCLRDVGHFAYFMYVSAVYPLGHLLGGEFWQRELQAHVLQLLYVHA